MGTGSYLGTFAAGRIVDGDTLYVDGLDTRVRLIGIDTPERGNCYFDEAAAALANLVTGHQVRLYQNPGNEQDRFGRPLAFVEVGDVDAGYELIAAGYAVPRFNSTDGFTPPPREAAYEAAYEQAPATCANSPDIALADGPPAGGEAPSSSQRNNGECLIKGNINRNGERIFHLPGGRWYAATVIDESAGERWFCTVEEAIAAGWRAAGG